MENQPVLKTPQEWEDQYTQQLKDTVANWQSYTDQLKAANYGSFGTQGSSAALDYAKRIREYFDQYNVTAQWFSDRQMPNFPNYLAFVKQDFDGVIGILTQMYQDNLATDQKIYAINAQSHIDMMNSYNNIYMSQKQAFDAMNDKWMKNFGG